MKKQTVHYGQKHSAKYTKYCNNSPIHKRYWEGRATVRVCQGL